MMLRYSSDCPFVIAGASYGPNEMPGQLGYFVADPGSATIAIARYGRRGAVRIIGLFLDMRRHSGVLQLSSPGRDPSIADFAAAARRVFFAGLAAAFLARRLRKGAYSDAI
jgi:hypothetical protein